MTSLGSQDGYTSDSDEDPNEAAFRPRREASIRARFVIASACGVRNNHRHAKAPSQLVKKELQDGPRTLSVDSFFKELEEELKYVIKAETKPTVAKNPDDEPSSTNGTSPGFRFSSRPSSDAPPESPLSGPTPRQIRKRPREVIDCVLLTSHKATPKRQRIGPPGNSALKPVDLTELDPAGSPDEAEVFQSKMKMWKNENVKKKEDCCLLPETLRARIRPIGFDVQDQHITVDKLTREHLVTREFMSQVYGGNSQQVEPKIGPRYRLSHEMRDFFYMNTCHQPQAPEVPGAPGLWFCTEPAPDKGVRRVFTKIQDRTAKRNNKWLYVGQYEILAAEPLTVEEWRAQPPVFHNAWANAILKCDWGVELCVRLHGRKLYNRDPTQSECNEIKSSGDFKEITREEIKEAYFFGKERMGIWTMKCVGYDNPFQQQISELFTPDWVPEPKKGGKTTEINGKNRSKKEEEKLLKLESAA